MPDDKRLGALHQAGKRRGGSDQHDICGGIIPLGFKCIGPGVAGEYMNVISERAAACGTLGCTDTRPAVYPESERLYYCISGAE
jgi:hypothetical protein